MKNIHIIRTVKPSRLCEFGSTWFTYKEPRDCFRNYNIYITSDENIKEGDWCLYNKKHDSKTPEWELIKCGKIEREEMHPISDGRLLLWMVKVIMTTAPDIVKDGIQSIDDMFLEWFVQNSSCEEVEIEYQTTGLKNGVWQYDYKIIIPKQDWLLSNPQCKQIESCSKSLSKKCICPKEEHPREMILMNANTTIDTRSKPNLNNTVRLADIKQVVQNTFFPDNLETTQKRSYSKEEVDNLLDRLLEYNMCSHAGDELIEQFKNKQNDT